MVERSVNQRIGVEGNSSDWCAGDELEILLFSVKTNVHIEFSCFIAELIAGT